LKKRKGGGGRKKKAGEKRGADASKARGTEPKQKKQKSSRTDGLGTRPGARCRWAVSRGGWGGQMLFMIPSHC